MANNETAKNAPAKVKAAPNHATVTITMTFEQETVFKQLVGENKTSPFVRMAIREYAKTQNIEFPADKERVTTTRMSPKMLAMQAELDEMRALIAKMRGETK